MKIIFGEPIEQRPGRDGLVAMTQQVADFFAERIAERPQDWHVMQPFFHRTDIDPVSGRLRVGLVCPYSFDSRGGVQSHVVGLARFLTAAGHDVRLLAPGKLAADAGLHPEQFTSAGAAIPVPYNGSVARVNFGPAGRTRARRWLQHGNFDVIHIHEPITPSIALLALLEARAPVVATFHAAIPRSRTMELAAQALRAVIAKIAIGIAVSEPARRVVRQHLRRDAEVIPNGFHFADFATDSAPSRLAGSWRGGDRPRLSFLGRTDEPRKGLSVLLDALPDDKGLPSRP